MFSFDEVSVSKSDKFKSKVQFPKASERHRKSPYPMIPATVATEIVLRDTNTLRHQFVAIKDSFGYILYDDVIAEEPYPPFPASIKDGYAVLTDDTTETRKVVGSVTPGGHLDFHLQPGQCVRVSTGSAIPDQSDAVIQVEDTTVIEDDDEGNEVCIKILKQVEKRYQDIRPVGSDILKGEVLIPKYHKVSAAEIGVMVTCGIETISVFQKPVVSLLSTGDELLEPGTPLIPGYIRDCNRTSLEFMLYENRISMFDAGIAGDTPDDIKSKLMSAFEMSDVVITTGSVSMGEKDILKQVLETDFCATIQFARIKMKPGKPTTFSTACIGWEEE
ncbi:gephyrin, partial [Caerostris extrusa]